MALTLAIGIATGCVYALIAVGYSLTYRTTGVVNFAQGSYVMVGGFATWWFFAEAGLTYPLAIAAGIVVGRNLGASALAALTTRGFSELARLGRACGARPETLAGLSGLGDLILSCSSLQSRNFALGIALGRGEPAPARTPGIPMQTKCCRRGTAAACRKDRRACRRSG